ncbi:MAG: dihydroorotase [Candidatus Theseobacter exili]|nr:dihydroorotase [Candidatus Theseobacter exili]
MDILIKGGRIVDPSQDFDCIADLGINMGKIVACGSGIKEKANKVVDATGLIVVPGLIDMHVHFREPGMEEKETIYTGMRAAAKGGFSSVATMPNTKPATDNEGIVKYILTKTAEKPLINVFPVAAATLARDGKQMTEIGELKKAGAVALSDDGDCITNSALLRRILEYAGSLDMPVLEHCEDPVLSGQGVMNESIMSTILGLKGIPAASEVVMVARDLTLCKMTGSRLHIQHVSSAGSVELIRWAKSKGVPVTAETAPHYLVLTDDDLHSYSTMLKVKPPIGSKHDREELIKAVKDGTIDAIASDHAPHLHAEKDVEFDYAPFGMIGLESSIPLIMETLINPGILDFKDLVRLMSLNPANILGLKGKGSLKRGADGDVTLIDPEKEVVLTKDYFESKSINTPFLNWKCKGAPTSLFVSGKQILKDEKIIG